MEGAFHFLSTQRVAVVTGANKGIGLEICRQLASKGVIVVLTSRDERRGIEAVEGLIKKADLSDNLIFHQLDVMDLASIASLAEFIKNRFGKLDILVNNAAIIGVKVDTALVPLANRLPGGYINWNEVSSQTHELAEECLATNYYGAKSTVEAFIPLLRLSNSGRIVNVSSISGKLKYVANKWAQTMLDDVNGLSLERVDEVLNKFLQDFKQGSLEAEAWPCVVSAYTLSKAAMNAYTRLMAKNHPELMINCVCPGYVKTDINCNNGVLTVEEGAQSPVGLALLPKGEPFPSGLFFSRQNVSPF